MFVLSLIMAIFEIIKEKTEPVIPAENWANIELYKQDIINGISHEQRMRNLQNGKYKLS